MISASVKDWKHPVVVISIFLLPVLTLVLLLFTLYELITVVSDHVLVWITVCLCYTMSLLWFVGHIFVFYWVYIFSRHIFRKVGSFLFFVFFVLQIFILCLMFMTVYNRFKSNHISVFISCITHTFTCLCSSLYLLF